MELVVLDGGSMPAEESRREEEEEKKKREGGNELDWRGASYVLEVEMTTSVGLSNSWDSKSNNCKQDKQVWYHRGR